MPGIINIIIWRGREGRGREGRGGGREGEKIKIYRYFLPTKILAF